ncbi:MAG TPA: ATP-binding cassette domain-containing protein [Gemmatimonadaceae bacterium]|nr:ATP-binding cassette domain-containing protein [Gemmatimonadaceae bacterium]
MPALSIHSLRKSFLFGHRQAPQRREALRGVDLDVERGEIVAVIGDKGCGKTTLLLCAAGLLRPDSGSIHWYGTRFAGGGCHPNLVYIPAVPTYYPFLTVRDVLSQHSRRDNKRFTSGRTIEELSQRVSLAGKLATSVIELEASEVKLLAIAQAIIEDPKVIVLDGTLDTLEGASSLVRQVIGEERSHCPTLIIASRHPHAVVGAATRVVVMHAGRVTASFSAECNDGSSAGRIAFADIEATVRQIAERVH